MDALAHRAHQLVALELRTTPPQHRPPHHHRLAQLALAITALITAKLIDWRNRWMPELAPTR
jgi:hypothetical protein